MRACFSVISLSCIPREHFWSAKDIMNRYGYHPNEIVKFLDRECCPCLKVRYSGVVWWYYDAVQYKEFYKLLRECIDVRGKIVARNIELDKNQLEELVKRNRAVKKLKQLASEIPETPRERIARHFKLQIMRWENQTKV